MTQTMWRVGKHEGVGNVVLEQVPLPEPGENQALVRIHASLISRGSELWRRYELQEAVDPGIMGYSTSGVVERVGPGVTALEVGDKVVVTAPHAEYTIANLDPAAVKGRVSRLGRGLSFEEGTFHPLSTSANGWTQACQITPQDRVVVIGQGIVGNLVMQFAKRYKPAQLIAVDALDIRCHLAKEAGGPDVHVVHAGEEDPVEAVKTITNGQGASIVIDCVGGRAGLKSFAQAQQMLAAGGLLQLIGLYHGEPLPLDAQKMMGKRLIGSYPITTDRNVIGPQAMFALVSGEVTVQPLITHRFAGREAKQAFDFLYQHPEQAMGVLMLWD
jgi:threonine dehydrogenase-like Zn-dependent dehydrogenase